MYMLAEVVIESVIFSSQKVVDALFTYVFIERLGERVEQPC